MSFLSVKSIKYTFTILLCAGIVFFYIYSPRLFFNINIQILLAIFSSTMLLLFFNVKRWGINYQILLFGFVSIFYFLYFIITKKNDNPYITSLLSHALFSVPISLYVVLVLKKIKFYYDNYIKLLILIGFIQAVFSIIILINPAFKTLVHTLYQNNGIDFSMYSLNYWSKIRMNGISSNLFYGMPLVQGYIAVCSVWYGIKYKKILYYLISVIIAFSAVINARIGIISYLVGLLILFLLRINILNILLVKRIRIGNHYYKFKTYIFILVMYFLIKKTFNATYYTEINKWIIEGFKEIFGFFTQKGEYYLTYKNSISVPNNIGLVFGTGEWYFLGKGSLSTDIGYINDIYMGGIIFCFIIYWSYLREFLKNLSELNIILIVFFLIANFKGMAILNNDFIRLLIFMMCLEIYRNRSVNP